MYCCEHTMYIYTSILHTIQIPYRPQFDSRFSSQVRIWRLKDRHFASNEARLNRELRGTFANVFKKLSDWAALGAVGF